MAKEKNKKSASRRKIAKRRVVKVKSKPRFRSQAHARAGQVHANPPAAKNGPSYVLNPDFEFFYELRDLILKSSPAEKDNMIDKINKLGHVKLAIISGIFMNKESIDPFVADLLLVGDDMNSRKLRSFLKALEAEVGKEIKFSLMEKDEFMYRLAMFDRFVRVVIESPHEKLINKLNI